METRVCAEIEKTSDDVVSAWHANPGDESDSSSDQGTQEEKGEECKPHHLRGWETCPGRAIR